MFKEMLKYDYKQINSNSDIPLKHLSWILIEIGDVSLRKWPLRKIAIFLTMSDLFHVRLSYSHHEKITEISILRNNYEVKNLATESQDYNFLFKKHLFQKLN